MLVKLRRPLQNGGRWWLEVNGVVEPIDATRELERLLPQGGMPAGWFEAERAGDRWRILRRAPAPGD
jgi:hypothetical protein